MYWRCYTQHNPQIVEGIQHQDNLKDMM